MESYDAIYRRLQREGHEAWTGSGYQRAREQLNATLGRLDAAQLIPTGGTCLEMGCGNGAMASHCFAEKGFQVFGVDISAVAIKWARSRFAASGLSGHFDQGDVCDLVRYPDATFDVVFDGSCFRCLIGPQRAACLKALHRVLAANGTLIISSMCGAPKQKADLNRYDARSGVLMVNGHPWRTLKPLDALIAEIADAGFMLVGQAVNVNPWWDHATLVYHKAPSPSVKAQACF